MNSIKLHNQFYPETTAVPNYFIDKYMPAANGAFVKVYLYLLRRLSNNCELSIDIIAEELDETQKDINRAFTYWENLNLLSVTRNNEQLITDISIISLNNEVPVAAALVPEPILKADEDTSLDELSTQTATNALKPNYTKAQIDVMIEVDEIKWLLSSIEQYLERLLKPVDIQLILYFYEGLAFSAELILYLYEYCISLNKKSHHYIEAVALAWSKDGIDTVEKAEETAELYNTNLQAVYKTFGIDRNLGSIEKQYIAKWFESFKLDKALIEEALNRTLLTTGKPDFKYADKIITNWHKKNVKTLSDIKSLDEEHQAKASQTQPKKKMESAASQNNKFNAFPQRNHTNEYYNSLEKHLLNKV